MSASGPSGPLVLSSISMAIPLAVSVVLSLLTVYVLLPSSESVASFPICTNAINKRPY